MSDLLKVVSAANFKLEEVWEPHKSPCPGHPLTKIRNCGASKKIYNRNGYKCLQCVYTIRENKQNKTNPFSKKGYTMERTSQLLPCISILQDLFPILH